MSTGNGKSDTLNFGKYKGRRVNDLLASDPQYLCWLRDKVAKDSRQAFFDADVNDILDGFLMHCPPKERARFRHWASRPPEFMVKMTFPGQEPEVVAEEPMADTVVAYTPSADWGSW